MEEIEVELPIASKDEAGIVKVGQGLSVDEDGTLNVKATGGIANESDPTVPAWAKEPDKPTYTADEVGALPDDTPVIYVGAERPTDDNVAVWIDPDGEAELIPPATTETLGGIIVGDGLSVDEDGRVGVQVEGEYELIETIVLDDGIAVLERTAWPDGTPYDLSRIIIKLHMLPHSNSYPSINVGINTLQNVTITNALSQTGDRYSSAYAWVESGLIRLDGNKGTEGAFLVTDRVGTPYARTVVQGDAITRVVIAPAPEAAMPAGSEIELWGVRRR